MFITSLVLLLVISICIGIIGVDSVNFKLFFNRFDHFNYHIGFSYRQFRAKNPDSSETLHILSIGLFFCEVEVDFLKK